MVPVSVQYRILITWGFSVHLLAKWQIYSLNPEYRDIVFIAIYGILLLNMQYIGSTAKSSFFPSRKKLSYTR